MKFDKGLYTDSLEVNQPQGTYRFAKNIVDSNLLGIIENEDGFRELTDVLPYTLIGVIPIEDGAVVFTTDDTDSEIGTITRSGGTLTYQTIYTDQALNFSTSAPIKGEYRKELTGDRVVTWIDDNNPPRILNIDEAAQVDNVNDLEVFGAIANPELTTPVTNDSGGALKVGTYIPITRYKTVDGSVTNWFVHDHVFSISNDPKSGTFASYAGSIPDTITNKSISFILEGCDTTFGTIEVGYVYSSNNVVTIYSVTTATVDTNVPITLTGNETATSVSLDAFLTPSAIYTNAKAITQMAGRLYLGNLTSSSLPVSDLQVAAMDIKIDYTRSLVDVIQNTNNHRDNLPPTFTPGEVYAFYLGVELREGGWLYYHIPGRPAVSNETQQITDEGMTYKRFQIDDTTDAVGAYSTMGFWENSNETYPDEAAYVGAIAGDLRGQNVRHHRFPTTAKLMTFYTGDATVGLSKLPQLGISVSNVDIPDSVKPFISRWKIFFAKKNPNDSLFMGPDLLHLAAYTNEDSTVKWSSGGNWEVWNGNGSGYTKQYTLRTDSMRIHSPDLFISNSGISPTYARFNYSLRRSNVNEIWDGFGTNGGTLTVDAYASSSNDWGTVTSAVIDYTNTTYTSRISSTNFKKRLDNFAYLPENANSGKWYTSFNERSFIADINNSNGFSTLDKLRRVYTNVLTGVTPSGGFFTGTDATPANNGNGREETMYVEYYRYLTDVHSSFLKQDLCPVEGYADKDETTLTGSGGDSYICFISYMTAALRNSPTGGPSSGAASLHLSECLRIWRGYIGYSKYNLNYRYQDTGDIYTYFHAKTDVRELFTPTITTDLRPSSTQNYIPLISTNASNNKISYSTDFNIDNIFAAGVIYASDLPAFSTGGEVQPNTIIYSAAQNEESLEFSWRTFRSEDKYVLNKNKGDIKNLQGFRNRELLIHTTDALFRTRTDAQAATDSESIYLKSANIFDLPPEELIPTPEGYAGTQHKFGCILTKMGYFFPDDKRGKVFLYDGQLQEISSNGMRIFFRDFMNLKEDPFGPDDNPFTNIGYTAGYDERNNRILLTKKSSNDQSWTISYNPIKKVWVSYHTYTPSYYFSTNENSLYAYTSNRFFLVNGDPTNTHKGQYFTNLSTVSSFIDVVYTTGDKDVVFTGTNWITESYPLTVVSGQPSSTLNYANTFTHLTARSTDHCSGRIQLLVADDFNDLYSDKIRNKNRTWYYNNIRDVKITDGFVKGFYDDFEIDTTKLNTNMEWYDQRKFTDKFVICRYEYDNTVNNRLLFSSADIEARPI
jgi:hypothetical protein